MKNKIIYITISFLILTFFLLFPGTRFFDNFLYDSKISFFKHFGHLSERQGSDLVLAEIDRKTLAAGSGRIGYLENASFLKQMRQAGAKCVVFSFPPKGNSSSSSGKEEFLGQMNGIPVFLVSYFDYDKFRPSSKNLVTPDQQLTQRAAGTGMINLISSDKVLRQKKLAAEHNGKQIPSIELIVSAFLKNVPSSKIHYKKQSIYLDSAMIPMDENNYVFFTPPNKDFFSRYSYVDLLDKKHDLKGKTIVVGWSAEDDVFVNIPAVIPDKDSYAFSIASTIHNIVSGLHVSNFPRWFELLIVFFLAGSIGFFLPMLQTDKIPLVTCAIIVLMVFLNLILFRAGFELAAGAVILTALVFGLATWQYRYHKTKSMTSRFVHMKLIKLLQKDDSEDEMGTVVRKAAILFSDIKGYTTFAERNTPAELMEILNEYVKRMNRIVEENRGVVLNYQGDSLMAIFGLTDNINYEKEAAHQAVKTAISMQYELEELRRRWHLEGRELFVVGIGVCVGEVAVGVLGNESFRQYTAVGDPVNEAARLQALAKEMKAQVLVGDKAHVLIRDKFQCTKVQQTFLKGKFQASGVYQVDGYLDEVSSISQDNVSAFKEKSSGIVENVSKYDKSRKRSSPASDRGSSDSLGKDSTSDLFDDFEEIKKSVYKNI
jgi:class 3 adenylate cyclase